MATLARPLSGIRSSALGAAAIAVAIIGAAASTVFAQSSQKLPPGVPFMAPVAPEPTPRLQPPRDADAVAFALRELLEPSHGDERPLQDIGKYKQGEAWWRRNFRGFDFLEPLMPAVATSQRDFGNIVLDSVLPYGLLITAFAARSTDQGTLTGIGRWGWVSIDEKEENYPVEIGLIALGASGILLPPGPGGAQDYAGIVLDRGVVFALGLATASVTTRVLKHALARRRPNGDDSLSRPSEHATIGFAAMAFLSNVLRDTIQPEKESALGLRILEEVATAVPYLGAGYLALERVHGKDHFLTDTLLGGAIGTFSMNMFHAWSFTRTKYGSDRGWIDHVLVGYDPTLRGIGVIVRGRF